MAKNRSHPIPQHGRGTAAEAEAQRLYMEGLTLHHQGELAKAAAAYEQVLCLVPKHVEALHHVGIIAFQEGNHELAAGFIRSALAQNPGMAGAHCDLGNALKELKQFDKALQSYERAIQLAPDDSDAYYNRGVALHAMRRLEEATVSYDRALALNPEDVQAYNNRGVTLKELKRYEAALASYERALALWPDYYEAHNNRGNVFRELGQFIPALECFDHAIALNPRFADAHCNRGIALEGLERYQDALDSFDRALGLSPDFAEAYHNRAIAFFGLKRWEQALADSQQAIRLRPDYAEAYAWLGETLQEMGQFEAAVKSYDVALRLGHETAELHERRSAALKELRKFDAALEAIDRALALKSYPIGLSNRGNLLLAMDRHQDALENYEGAIAQAPELTEAHNNRAIVLGDLGRDEEALESFDRALALNPELGLAHWNRALLNLRRGNLAEAWPDYEWRWKTPTLGVYKEKRELGQLRWSGTESLEGKVILLYAEQGLGDTLQMCRYVERVAALGARIVLEVQPGLSRLLDKLPGVAQVIVRGQPLPPFDFECPLMSLPGAFRTSLESIPSPDRYLESDAALVAKWEATLGPKRKPRVGVVWSGSTVHKGDHNRSIALADFAPLISDDCEFISLQKEVREADQPMLDSLPQLRHFGARIDDMADTAALCELMDLVICVDTSIAHLAGALGKPVWILVPAIADWRWLRERTTSPWYPSARLYRQLALGQWAPVLAAVEADLAGLEDRVEAPEQAQPQDRDDAGMRPDPYQGHEKIGAERAHSPCPVCNAEARMFDVVDFNKNCEESRGKFLPLSGRPIYYHRCVQCAFTYAPEFQRWTDDDFLRHVYNDKYVEIDPDYMSARPLSNAKFLDGLFGTEKHQIRHLDYGGGNGVLSAALNKDGWNSTSYDPFPKSERGIGELGKFNLITAFEVFEHVPDVAILIRNLLALAEEECVIIFSTLLSDGHVSSNNRLTWWYASPRNGHISLFSKQSLVHVAEQNELTFGSFSEGFHCFIKRLPRWAEKLVDKPN
jgi:tetratricopeptide (TPR) repeat protein